MGVRGRSGGSYRCGWTDAKTLEIGDMAVHGEEAYWPGSANVIGF
jgi:hypothetical protein